MKKPAEKLRSEYKKYFSDVMTREEYNAIRPKYPNEHMTRELADVIIWREKNTTREKENQKKIEAMYGTTRPNSAKIKSITPEELMNGSI
jgi:hypothetical protein